MRTNAGFHVVEALIVVVFVGIVGALGWTFYSKTQSNEQAKTSTSQGSTSTSSIESDKDLSSVSSELDSMPADDSSDTSQLDTSLESL